MMKSMWNKFTTVKKSIFSPVSISRKDLPKPALPLTDKTEDRNENNYLLKNLNFDPDQIDNISALTNKIALLLKVKPDDVSKSERFENLVIRFLQQLDSEQLPFLNANIDVTGNAHYDFGYDRIGFKFNQFSKKHMVVMANVIEQYFPGSNTKLTQFHMGESYWISFDKKEFLQKMLPCIFGVRDIPQKQIQRHQPDIQDANKPTSIQDVGILDFQDANEPTNIRDKNSPQIYIKVVYTPKPLTEEDNRLRGPRRF